MQASTLYILSRGSPRSAVLSDSLAPPDAVTPVRSICTSVGVPMMRELAAVAGAAPKSVAWSAYNSCVSPYLSSESLLAIDCVHRCVYMRLYGAVVRPDDARDW